MENLGELSTVPSRVAKAAAAIIAQRIAEQFDNGADPYGRSWSPLRPATLAKGRRPPPLTDSGTMRSSVRVVPLRGAGIEITIGAPYAHFHQTGTKHMVERSILPDGSELPEEWDDAIEQATTEAVARAMKGKR